MWPHATGIQPFLSRNERLSPLPMSQPEAPRFAVALLSVAAFAAAANMRVTDPLLIELAAEFHVTVGAASIAATLFLLANGLFVLVHGPSGDRYGKMPVIAFACVGAALCCVGSALSVSLGMLAGMRFLTGVTSSAIIPLSIAWVGDNVGYEKRQATLARFLTGQTLGLAAGAALGGAVGDWLGWRSAFWMLATVYLLAGAALFATMRARPDIARPGPRAPGSMAAQMLGVLHRRWARTVITVVALEGGAFWGCFTFVATDLHQRFGLGFAFVGLAVAAFGSGGFIYVTVAAHLVRLLGERGLCLWGGSALGIAFALLALAPNAIVAFAIIVVIGISFYMLHNTLQTNGTQMAPEARGSALALFALCLFVGQAIGVPIAAPIVDRYGAPPIFCFAAVFLPALAWWFAGALKRRAAEPVNSPATPGTGTGPRATCIPRPSS
jgi:predicted MFS family arabinose efflux permease